MSTTRMLLMALVIFGSLGSLGCATADFYEEGASAGEEELLEEEASVDSVEQAASTCKLWTGFSSARAARSYCYRCAWDVSWAS